MHNNEEPKPHKTWKMYMRVRKVIENYFLTVDNKKLITADGKKFLVKEV